MKKEDIKKRVEQAKRLVGHHVNETEDFRESWRIFRIMAELVEGYQFLSAFQNEITIFGSARLDHTTPLYETARELGALLAKAGFTVITGGGPGIMEGANRGATESGGESLGLNVQLPFEQLLNPYVKKSASFYYFFTRKVMLTSPSNGFVFFPGGFGTFDEFLEVTDLMDLGFINKMPIVLVDKSFWQPIVDFLLGQGGAIGVVQQQAVASWHVVDTAEEAFAILKDVKDIPIQCSLSPDSFQCEGSVDWKMFRIMAELVEGFEFVSRMPEAVTILGTKEIEPGDTFYTAAHTLGGRLAEHGYSVITGGMHGIAEAANHGAFEVGGESIGIGMQIGKKIELNPYLTKSMLFHFPYTRKLIITAPTAAFVVFPGGFGTLHHFFEVLTLMQTKKMPSRPIILYDRSFWEPIHAFIKEKMVHVLETVADEDDELYHIVDDEESIMKIIEEFHKH